MGSGTKLPGIILEFGQNYFLKVLFQGLPVSDSYYLGLHTFPYFEPGLHSSIDVMKNLGDGNFKEVQGNGYSRIRIPRLEWIIIGGDGLQRIHFSKKVFNVCAGGWPCVNGYFIALSAEVGKPDALWAESFNEETLGDKEEEDTIGVSGNFSLRS